MKWKIAQRSYIHGLVVEPNETVTLEAYIDPKTKKLQHHLPGPHWEPADEEAERFAEKMKHVYTGEMPDAVNDMVSRLEQTMSAGGNVVIDHDKLAAAFANALGPIVKSIAAPAPGVGTDEFNAAVEAAVAKALAGRTGADGKLLVAVVEPAKPGTPAPGAK